MKTRPWLERMLAVSRRGGLAEGTLEWYRSSLEIFADFLEARGIDHPAQADARVISEFQSHLLTLTTRLGRPYATGTRIHMLVAVKKLYQHLQDEGRVLIDPTVRLRMPRQGRRLPRALLTAAEMRRLLEAPDTRDPWGLRDRAILELLYSTGLRFAEMAGLRVEDVDVVERTLWVRQGKGRRDRVLPLGRWATFWMKRYLNATADLRRRQSTERIFLTPHGNELANRVFNGLVKRYAAAAKIAKNVSAHTIRHSFATLLLSGGADVRKIQRLLGHAKLDSTEIYTHLNLTDLRRVQEKCHPRERWQTRRGARKLERDARS